MTKWTNRLIDNLIADKYNRSVGLWVACDMPERSVICLPTLKQQ